MKAMQKMKNEKEHINIDQIGKRNPFKVPEGYFDTFSDRLMTKIDEPAQEKSRFIGFRALKPVLALAASFALVFLLVYVPMNTFFPSEAKNNQGKATPEYEYFEYLAYFGEHTIYQLINEEHTKTPVNYDIVETVLTASLTDYELYENQ
jgi:hypothetical protein